MCSINQNIKENRNKSNKKKTSYSFKNITWFVNSYTLDLVSLKPPWASIIMALWSSILYLKLINFFDNFFASPLRCRTFHSKPLNKSLKNDYKSCTQANSEGGTPYGQVPLPLIPFGRP